MDGSLHNLYSALDEKNKSKLAKIHDTSIVDWIARFNDLCSPSRIFINSGTEADVKYIKNKALAEDEELPTKYVYQTVHFDGIKDQARDRNHTYIAAETRIDGIKNYVEKKRAVDEVLTIMRGIMKGKEMLVGFYALGPKNSDFSIPAVQITDSSYVMHSEELLYRNAYDLFLRPMKSRPFFFVHSEGELENNVSKNVEQRRVLIDVDDEVSYSVNTQYAGNTVGLKKLALRLGIKRGVREGFLMEHMLLVGINNNERRGYFTGAYPSLCGKTSTAMMLGESLIGDDIAILKNVNGEVRAVNTDRGVFGVIDGINSKDDPIIWDVLHSHTEVIYSNVLITPEGEARWNGDGLGEPDEGKNFAGTWHKGMPLSNPNARFTVSLKGFPNLDPAYDDPAGVPVKGIVYGGRDYDTWVPVQESFNWNHGAIVYGASIESQSTAATIGATDVREFNPMAIFDFLSVNIGDYLKHYMDFGAALKTPPRIFAVNYFLKDSSGEFLTEKTDKRIWFKWMEMRASGDVTALEAPTGYIPSYESLSRLFDKVLNKSYSRELYIKQFSIRVDNNLRKIKRVISYYRNYETIPAGVFQILSEQETRLTDALAQYGSVINPELLTIK
ncbi:MAG: phosphoenolpyruvate carboxykinase (GTP) [Nitrososphaerota archaeon]|nr:phosphoenolpyruvate carboxykinase (GTP) [Nitrososphaerota archaeon]MDG6930870.1 phosphoenolpyruvate carboxykinase (GTP) [Nitrososphaerota archaeon]MDG6932473.1 phosphoenolpyruvate carboxykinase (GTP) [Nitrososphaerota archaeon]MDG6936083.1 phosphoenolpyruvate carboxykinase (GTP) [Nitrososphaerota archaeon]MDG6943727.1 phosphoenolpyruvate carboxykinase (GTP) [Nitrososphaerota archaeon]